MAIPMGQVRSTAGEGSCKRVVHCCIRSKRVPSTLGNQPLELEPESEKKTTRMHLCRMLTAHSLAVFRSIRRGNLANPHPRDAAAPLETDRPWIQTSLEAEPLDADPSQCRFPQSRPPI